MHQMQVTPDDRESPTPQHRTKVSPVAIGLTFATVIFAVVIGLTGPRLQERHGTTQQDLPIGDLATIAAMHEMLVSCGLETEYAVVRDARTLMPVDESTTALVRPTRALIAARLGHTRLIDNASMAREH